MRILIDQAVYDMRNKGNVALLQVAIRRLRNFWPNASLEVMTTAPYLLMYYCPGVIPVDVYGVRNWAEDRKRFDRLRRLIPKTVLRVLLELREEQQFRKSKQTGSDLEKSFSSSRPERFHTATHMKLDLGAVSGDGYSSDLEQALRGADLVVATGGGYLMDSDKGSSIPVLSRLDRARQMGKFTVMVGQGLGVIEDPDLTKMAKQVLPALDLILVREGKFSLPFLKSLGVSEERST